MGIHLHVRAKTRWMSPTFGWLSAPLLVVAAVPVVAGDARVPYEVWFGGVFAALAIWLVLSVTESRRVRTTHGVATVDRAGLGIGTSTRIRREDVRHAFVVDANTLRVITKRHDLEIGCEEGAAELMAAMQLGSRASVGHFHLRRARMSWLQRGCASALILGVTLAALTPFFVTRLGWLGFRLCPLAILWMGCLMLAMFLRRSIAVGSDGVRWQHGIFSHRFISFSEIAAVKLTKDDLALVLRDGTTERAYLDETAWEAYPMRKEAVSLAARIQERLDASSAVPRLRGATHESVCEEAFSYRVQGQPADVLWRIVEDGSYEPRLRLDAVAALQREPTNGTDLRAITEASADPDLAGALRAR